MPVKLSILGKLEESIGKDSASFYLKDKILLRKYLDYGKKVLVITWYYEIYIRN